MKDFINQLAIIGMLSFGVYQFVSSSKPSAVTAQQSPIAEVAVPVAAPQQQGKLHKMTLQVSEPNDLKVKVGDNIPAAQIVADQDGERKRLNLRKNELQLAIKRIENQKISPPEKATDPSKPKPAPPMMPLPDISYQQYEAAIEKAKNQAHQQEEILNLKRRELDYLKGIEGLDSAIIEHEFNKLSKLENELKSAKAEMDLEIGKLLSAKEARKQDEYQHQLNTARRVEEENKSLSFYQQQIAENQINYQRSIATFEKESRDRDYQFTQLKIQLSSVEDSIAQLAVIRSPYAGKIRRIKFLGQTDNKLGVELTMVISDTSTSTSTSPITSTKSSSNPIAPSSSTTAD
jgi:Spy/CpxP family protein refolding chaperone